MSLMCFLKSSFAVFRRPALSALQVLSISFVFSNLWSLQIGQNVWMRPLSAIEIAEWLHLLLSANDDLNIALIDNASQTLNKHFGRCVILETFKIAEFAFRRSVRSDTQSSGCHGCGHRGIHFTIHCRKRLASKNTVFVDNFVDILSTFPSSDSCVVLSHHKI